jgi:hypothetical protein
MMTLWSHSSVKFCCFSIIACIVASGEKKMKLDFLAMICDGNMQLMQYESRDRILPPCSS